MAMPNNSLSQIVLRYRWAGLDTDDPTDLTDYEEGGIALNNTSKGLQYQLWTYTAEGKDVYVEAPNTGGKIKLFSISSDIEILRGAFDQNMNPFVAYRSANQWHYRWFDTTASVYVTSDLPSTTTSCCCTLDDKRMAETGLSDILLFYTNNGNLYQRRQRDRYTSELLVRESVSGKLVKVGMNGLHRLQFKLQVV